MPRARLLAFGLVLAAASPTSAASHFAEEEQDPMWEGELGANVPGELDRQSPSNADTPISHTAIVTPQLTGGFFLHSLVDEADGAIALLPFYQHPGEVTLQVGSVNAFADSAGPGWTATTRGLALDAHIEGYPWHETGLMTTVGTTFDGISGSIHGAAEARYGVGIVHYFRPNLRGEVSYVGSADQSTLVISSLRAPEVQDLEAAANAARARFVAVLLHDQLGVDVHVQLGQFGSIRSATAAGGGALPGDYTHGISYDGQVTATGYFGHRLSSSLGAGVQGSLSTTEPDQKTVAVSSTTVIAPLATASVQYFVADPVGLQLSYGISGPRVRGVNAPQADIIDQVATLSVLARL